MHDIVPQQTVTDRAKGQHLHTQLLRRGNQLALNTAIQERILHFHRMDGMHTAGAAQGLHVHHGEADVPDIAGLHLIGDGPHQILHGNGGIHPGGLVEINVVQSQTAQGIGQVSLDIVRLHVQPVDAALGGRAACRT